MSCRQNAANLCAKRLIRKARGIDVLGLQTYQRVPQPDDKIDERSTRLNVLVDPEQILAGVGDFATDDQLPKIGVDFPHVSDDQHGHDRSTGEKHGRLRFDQPSQLVANRNGKYETIQIGYPRGYTTHSRRTDCYLR